MMNRALFIGMFLGIAVAIPATLLFHGHSMLPAQLVNDENCGAEYSLINPWLRCEPQDNLLQKKEFTNFKAKLQKTIDQWKTEGRIESASVYVRDLQFGPWMGINEDDEYSAASLLKVPVLLTVLRQAQKNPAILGQRIEVVPEFFATKYKLEYPPKRSIEAGGVYTVDELLEYMIVYSDNYAKSVLDSYLQALSPDEPLVLRTLEELGIYGEYRPDSDQLTIKQAASLLRLLYNASYLNKDMSQKALELLVRSDFDQGIVAGVPSDLVVAHKFGERQDLQGVDQLHDCGIVFDPTTHYLVCIMTRGDNFDHLSGSIADISRMISDEIRSRENAQ